MERRRTKKTAKKETRNDRKGTKISFHVKPQYKQSWSYKHTLSHIERCMVTWSHNENTEKHKMFETFFIVIIIIIAAFCCLQSFLNLSPFCEIIHQ